MLPSAAGVMDELRVTMLPSVHIRSHSCLRALQVSSTAPPCIQSGSTCTLPCKERLGAVTGTGSMLAIGNYRQLQERLASTGVAYRTQSERVAPPRSDWERHQSMSSMMMQNRPPAASSGGTYSNGVRSRGSAAPLTQPPGTQDPRPSGSGQQQSRGSATPMMGPGGPMFMPPMSPYFGMRPVSSGYGVPAMPQSSPMMNPIYSTPTMSSIYSTPTQHGYSTPHGSIQIVKNANGSIQVVKESSGRGSQPPMQPPEGTRRGSATPMAPPPRTQAEPSHSYAQNVAPTPPLRRAAAPKPGTWGALAQAGSTNGRPRSAYVSSDRLPLGRVQEVLTPRKPDSQGMQHEPRHYGDKSAAAGSRFQGGGYQGGSSPQLARYGDVRRDREVFQEIGYLC